MGGILRGVETYQRISERSAGKDFAAENPDWMQDPEKIQQMYSLNPAMAKQGTEMQEQLRQMQQNRAWDRLDGLMGADNSTYKVFQEEIDRTQAAVGDDLGQWEGQPTQLPNFAEAEKKANDHYQNLRLRLGKRMGEGWVNKNMAPVWNFDGYQQRQPDYEVVANSMRVPMVLEQPDGTVKTVAVGRGNDLARLLGENPGAQLFNPSAYTRRTVDGLKDKWNTLDPMDQIDRINKSPLPPPQKQALLAKILGAPGSQAGVFEGLPGVVEKFDFLKDPERGGKLDPQLRDKLWADTVGADRAENGWRYEGLPPGLTGRRWADKERSRLEPIPGGPEDPQLAQEAAAAEAAAEPQFAWAYKDLPPAVMTAGLRWKDKNRTGFEPIPGGPRDREKVTVGQFRDMDPEKQQSLLNGWRDDFRKDAGPYMAVRDAWLRIGASADNASPAGDLSLIFNYMKMLDPASVVRESEFQQAAQSGSYGDQIQALVNRALTGQRLSPNIRADFVERAQKLYQAQEGTLRRSEAEYKRLAKAIGAPEEQAVLELAPDPETMAALNALAAQMPRDGDANTPAAAIPVADLPPEEQQALKQQEVERRKVEQAMDFSKMDTEQLNAVDIDALTPTQVQAYLKATGGLPQ